jgi:high-affinity K+ transport system ATPase subunit B
MVRRLKSALIPLQLLSAITRLLYALLVTGPLSRRSALFYGVGGVMVLLVAIQLTDLVVLGPGFA